MLGLRPAPFWTNFSICGASESPAETGGQGTPNDQSGSAAKDQAPPAGSTTGEPTRDPEARVAALTAEKDRHYRAAQAEKQRADDLAAKVEAAERKDRTELENANRDLQSERDTVARLQTSNRELALRIAFLTSTSDITWHDPGDALALADLSDVKVKDDGTVDNPDVLTKAIKDLAKRKPHLVKTGKADEPNPSSEKKDPPPNSGNPPSGTPVPAGTPDRSALEKKYPALRGR